MRSVAPALAEALAAEAATLALCVRIVRRDGVAIGFTTHDRPLTVDGLRHEPAPGFSPSAIALGGSDVEGGELRGAIGAPGLSEADLRAGCLDEAQVTIALVDWTQPAQGTLLLLAGRIGRIEVRDGHFSATVRTALDALDAQPVALCSPHCRAELGDPACQVNLAARRTLGRVTGSSDSVVAIAGLAGPPDRFAHGRLRVLSGPAAGLALPILASRPGEVTLSEAVATLDPGALVELTEGCDKRLETCRDRFANTLNFQGEPHVPGGDSVTRYGGL